MISALPRRREVLKAELPDRLSCLRHQFEIPFDCRLCDAKREADGNIEKARKIFNGGAK